MVTGLELRITQNSQSVVQNTSSVTVGLVIRWNGGSYNATGNAPGTLTVDGRAYDFKAVFNTGRRTSGSETIFETTLEIPHEQDGKKTLLCAGQFDTQTMAGTVYASESLTLTPIPRASRVAATSAPIGQSILIAVTRYSGSFTHSLSYRFGGEAGWVGAGGEASETEVRHSAGSVAFTLPEAFYSQIPDRKSAAGTITCHTYAGSEKMGETTAAFTAYAGEETCCPVITGTVRDENPATLALTGDDSVLVRGCSDAKCTVTAQARNGATLTETTVNGLPITDTLTIGGAETECFTFRATDSRGYTAAFQPEGLTLVPYIKLTCNPTARRTDPTSGNALLTVQGAYFGGSFGREENTLTLSYRVGEGDFTPVTPQLEQDRYRAEVPLSGLDYTRSHTLQVRAEDRLSRVEKTLTVHKGIPVFDWGEQDFAFHVPVSFQGGVGNLGQLLYPVGYIYLSVAETSPEALFGGTWQRLKDRFLLAAGDEYAPGQTGGEAAHTLTEAELPAHSHYAYGWAEVNDGSGGYRVLGANYESGGADDHTRTAGSGKAHNNLPPYLAVYAWQRTA